MEDAEKYRKAERDFQWTRRVLRGTILILFTVCISEEVLDQRKLQWSAEIFDGTEELDGTERTNA